MIQKKTNKKILWVSVSILVVIALLLFGKKYREEQKKVVIQSLPLYELEEFLEAQNETLIVYNRLKVFQAEAIKKHHWYLMNKELVVADKVDKLIVFPEKLKGSRITDEAKNIMLEKVTSGHIKPDELEKAFKEYLYAIYAAANIRTLREAENLHREEVYKYQLEKNK